MSARHVKAARMRLHQSQPSRFESLSVVMPVMNEVRSLIDTVDLAVQAAAGAVRRICLVVCAKTTPESLQACEHLKTRHAGLVELVWQKKPFLGGALQAGLERATGSHVVVMYSDGESDPASLSDLIAESRRHPTAIISASRWLRNSSFCGYPPGKLIANYCFQKLFSTLFLCNITDFSFGYRLYPRAVIDAIEWEENGHPFVFETIVKPLQLALDVREIPTRWRRRSEGASQLKPAVYLRYLLVGARVRCTHPSTLLKPAARDPQA